MGPMETAQASFDHSLRENPTGEARKDALRLDFDRKLKLEFHGTKVRSDAGLLAYRELDEALDLIANVHSADDWRSLLEPIVDRYRGYDLLRLLRGDAAFANPKIYRYLKQKAVSMRYDCRRTQYCMRRLNVC